MAELETNLPQAAKQHAGERASKRAVEALFPEPPFLVRFEPPPDYGADGSVELLRVLPDSDPRPTGRRAWFQLKHTSTPHQLADGSVSYPIETTNINYLGSHPCAFYLLYITTSQEVRFRWWRDIAAELARERPDWSTQETVRVRFSRVLDPTLQAELATEIDAHAEQVAQMQDGPGLIRSVTHERAHHFLAPDPLFVGRKSEAHELARHFARGTIIPILGVPDAGKSEFVRHALCQPDTIRHIQDALGAPLALVLVDPGRHLAPRLLRALAFALGVHKQQNIDAGDGTDRDLGRGVLLGQDWPGRVQGQHVLAVIEDAHVCSEGPEELRDLESLLASEPFRTGCALIISRWGDVPNGGRNRKRSPEVNLLSLPSGDAAALLRGLQLDTAVVDVALEEVAELPEVLLPGVIKHGAATFRAGVADRRLQSTADVLVDKLLDATEYVTAEVLKGLGLGEATGADGNPTALGTLFAMSVLGSQVVTEADFRGTGLVSPPVLELQKIGWCGRDGDSYWLTPPGWRSLRREILRAAKEEAGTSSIEGVAGGLVRLVGAVARRTAEGEFDGFASVLEAAIVWTREVGLSGTPLEAALFRALIPYAVDDAFFPVASADAHIVRQEMNSQGLPPDLSTAVANFVLAVRAGVAEDEFLNALRAAVDALSQATMIQAVHLRALDIGAFLGQRRFRRNRDILSIRRRLVGPLSSLAAAGVEDVAVLKWSASWALNTAAIAVSIGDSEAGRDLVATARNVVIRLPHPTSSHGAADRLWLESRLAQVESRIQADHTARVAKLRQALHSALDAFTSSPFGGRWLRFALRAAHRLSEDLRGDEDREALVIEVRRRLTGIIGVERTWPVDVCAQVAGFVRDAAAQGADPDTRLRMVRDAIDLLAPGERETVAVAHLGDNRPLLVLARSHAYAAACSGEVGDPIGSSNHSTEALRLAVEARCAAPTAPAWELCLRLVDQREAPSLDAAWHTDPFGGPRSQMTPELRDEIRAAQQWLVGVEAWDVAAGQLALWCLQRKWRDEGSLERWVARTQGPNEPWDQMSSRRRRTLLATKHRQRLAELAAIERKAGPFPDLYVCRMRAEAQFQRLLAIYGDHKVDRARVFAVLHEAKELWPDNHVLLAEEGKYQRYVWNYPDAVEVLRRVVATAPRGRDRRSAAVDLAEVLVTAAIHCGTLRFSDGVVTERTGLVAEARAILGTLLGFGHVSREVAVLRDRADLEAGVAIDWTAIDAAFRRVVGDVDSFCATVMDNLDELRAAETSLPARLADIVVREFTSSEVLRSLGSLYLRRAELGGSANPAEDCRKAYAVFLACRILEMAWSGSRKESATTSYQRGRAILTAARLTNELTPFAADLEGKRNLVHLAEAMLGRAEGLTVGLFHEEAKRLKSEAARLQRSAT